MFVATASHRRLIALFVCIALLAIAIRLPGLVIRSIWFDEAYSWKLIHHFSWLEMIQRTASDVHPPVDYVISRLLASCASDSILVLRLLALCYGVIAVVALTKLSTAESQLRHLPALSVGFWSGLFLVLQTDHVRWSQEARIYSLMNCLAVVSTLLLWKLLSDEKPNRPVQLGYVVTSSMLLYTHNFGLFYVATQLGFAYCYWFFRNRGSAASKVHKDYSLMLCPFVLYLPWVPILYRQVTSVKEDYWIEPVSLTSILKVLPDHFVSDYEFNTLPLAICGVLTSTVVILSVVSLARGTTLDKLLAAMTLAPVVIAIVVSLLLTPVLMPRYLLPCSLFFIVMAVRMLFLNTHRFVSHSVCAAVLLLLSWNAWKQLELMEEKPGMKGICDIIKSAEDLQQPIVVLRSYLLFEAQYYFRNELDNRRVFAIHNLGKASFYGGGPLMRKGEVHKPYRG